MGAGVGGKRERKRGKRDRVMGRIDIREGEIPERVCVASGRVPIFVAAHRCFQHGRLFASVKVPDSDDD